MKTDYPINLKKYFFAIVVLGILCLTITCVSLNIVKSKTEKYRNIVNKRTSEAIQN